MAQAKTTRSRLMVAVPILGIDQAHYGRASHEDELPGMRQIGERAGRLIERDGARL